MGILDVFKKPDSPAPEQTANTTTRPCILIVDDEQYLREFYSELLVQEGYEIILAGNGQEALNILSKRIPDLILLDIRMPVMDGIQMFTQMQNNEVLKNIKVIFLTNAGTMQNMELARNYSAYGFFIKSNVSPEEVINKVKTALSGMPSVKPYTNPL